MKNKYSFTCEYNNVTTTIQAQGMKQAHDIFIRRITGQEPDTVKLKVAETARDYEWIKWNIEFNGQEITYKLSLDAPDKNDRIIQEEISFEIYFYIASWKEPFAILECSESTAIAKIYDKLQQFKKELFPYDNFQIIVWKNRKIEKMRPDDSTYTVFQSHSWSGCLFLGESSQGIIEILKPKTDVFNIIGSFRST